MKDLLKYTLFLGGSILIWAKLWSIALGLGMLLYGCYHFNRFLTQMRLLPQA